MRTNCGATRCPVAAGTGTGPTGQPSSPEYICLRCNQPGHLIAACPTNGDPAYDRKFSKRSTGIPQCQLIKVADESVHGAMLNGDGTYSVYRTSAEGKQALLQAENSRTAGMPVAFNQAVSACLDFKLICVARLRSSLPPWFAVAMCALRSALSCLFRTKHRCLPASPLHAPTPIFSGHSDGMQRYTVRCLRGALFHTPQSNLSLTVLFRHRRIK